MRSFATLRMTEAGGLTSLFVGQGHHRGVVADRAALAVDHGIGGVAVTPDVQWRRVAGRPRRRRAQRPRDEPLDDAAQRLVERLDDLGNLVAACPHAALERRDADDLPVGQTHELGDDADPDDGRLAVVVERLEVAQVGLQHVVGAKLDRFARYRDDLARVLERIDDSRLHHQRCTVGPRGIGIVVRRRWRERDGDAPGAEVGRGRRRVDGELPIDRGQVGIERALGRHGIEIDRVVHGADQRATGKRRGCRHRDGHAADHLGVYPCLPLKTKPAGSRSSRVAMTFRLAVSWRSSRMVSDSSVRPASVNWRMGALLSATSLLSWFAAPSMLANALRASTSAWRSSPGSLPASALRVASSCGPTSMAIRLSVSATPFSLSNVLRNSATAPGRSASVAWIAASCLASPVVVVARLRSVSLTAPILSGLSSSFNRSTVTPALVSSSWAEVDVACRKDAPSRISG